MDSTRKIRWNSTGITDDSRISGYTQLNSRENHHVKIDIANQNATLNEIIAKSKLLLEAVNETTAENSIIGKDIQKLLSSLDIEPQSFSRDVNSGLDKISAILKREDLSEINETALAVNILKRQRDELMKNREGRELKRKYEGLCNRYAYLQDKINYVQDKVNQLNDLIITSKQNNESGYSDMIHKSTRLNDYKTTCCNLEQELMNIGLNDGYPQKLLDKYKTYMQLSGELVGINKSLSHYGDLPPDILQARVVLEQTEKRRQEVKQLLLEKMG